MTIQKEQVYKQLSTEIRDGLKAIYREISTASHDGAANDVDVNALFRAAYKQLSHDMKDGVRDIYQQMSDLPQEQKGEGGDARAFFQATTTDLTEVTRATEEATMKIMGLVEKQQELQAESAEIIAGVRAGTATPEQLDRLDEINKQLGDDLMDMTMAMSFQDLTGQRIKRVVTALGKIEETIIQLYVTSGLIMEGAESDPAKDATALKDEANRAMEDFKQNREVKSKLKGPSDSGMSQNAIDDMLAQLGM